MSEINNIYPLAARLLHMGMALFGIAAYLTAEGAEEASGSLAYLLHAWFGLSLAAFVLARVLSGLSGRAPYAFAGWSPFSGRQWALAAADVGSLLRLRVPERDLHQGLAGLTQWFGLVLFAWMGFTGTWMYFLGNGPETDLFELLEEAHEVGEVLIPLYLVLHVGSVVAHALAGHAIWRRMWSFRRASPPVEDEGT